MFHGRAASVEDYLSEPGVGGNPATAGADEPGSDGEVTGGGAGTSGGGGSSFGDTTEAGVREGDGAVTITPSAECEDETTTTTEPGSTPAGPAEPRPGRPNYTS